MSKLYTVKINDSITMGEAFFVSYKPPKLVMRLGAKSASQISVLRKHVPERTVMTFQLEYLTTAIRHSTVSLSGLKQTVTHGKDESFTSPKFRAQVTSADEPPFHFELTLLDNVDLSGLE